MTGKCCAISTILRETLLFCRNIYFKAVSGKKYGLFKDSVQSEVVCLSSYMTFSLFKSFPRFPTASYLIISLLSVFACEENLSYMTSGKRPFKLLSADMAGLNFYSESKNVLVETEKQKKKTAFEIKSRKYMLVFV